MRKSARRHQVLADLPAILAVGLVSVVCGTIIAYLVGVADTPGPDWTELGIQTLALCMGLALLGYWRRRLRASARWDEVDHRQWNSLGEGGVPRVQQRTDAGREETSRRPGRPRRQEADP